ncbi:MAG: FAD:protein FMN transferase [Ruminococcus sp.]|nr:FAD:protein FMN transferase [Ruminococcus sp.]
MNKSNFSKRILSIILILVISLFTGCSKNLESASAEIFAMDTVITLSAYGNNCTTALDAAKKEIYRLEKLFSVTNEESDISKLNLANGEATAVSEDTYELIKKAVLCAKLTEGRFDPTIYNVLKLWGFTTGNHSVPNEKDLDEALTSVNYKNIQLKKDNTISVTNSSQIDLGGIAKGYIADKAAQAMEACGIDYGIISLGGNVRTVGHKSSGESFSVGIKAPESNDYFATINTDDLSVITSGAYQRNFTENGKTYHHIIDPATGHPATSDAKSVTIIGKDGAMCDALSTAIFIGGSNYAETLQKKHPEFDYIILRNDSTVVVSKELRDSFSLSEGYSDLKIKYK